MNKLSFFKYATVALVLLNVGLLVYIVGAQGRRPSPPGDMKETAQTEMRLTDEQYTLFMSSAEAHQLSIAAMEQQQESLLQAYFLPASPQGDSLRQDSLLEQIGTIEKEKIQLTRQHFEEIRSLLKPDQIPGYEAFLEKALGRIFKKDKNPPPPQE